MKKLFLLLVATAFVACSKSDDDTPPVKLSNLKEMTSFKVTVDGKSYAAEIKDDFIKAVLPSSADLTKMSPQITISEKAKVTPGSGVIQDLTKTVEYTVTAEDKSTKVYKTFITKTSSQNMIESFTFTNLPEGASSLTWKNKNPLDMDTLIYKVPTATNIKALTSNIKVSPKATIDPASGTTLDYSKPVKYTVKAEDGTKREYLVMVDNTLAKVELLGITRDIFRGKRPKEVIMLKTNVLGEKEKVKVALLLKGINQDISLKVTAVNFATNEISVELPLNFPNNEYRLKVEIDTNNKTESVPFVLDGGYIELYSIADTYDALTDKYAPCNRLLIPGETFKANMYVERSKFSSYKFSLRKDGKDYPMFSAKLHPTLEQVEFTMPNVPTPAVESGRFELVIMDGSNKESVLKLINTQGSAIGVLVGGAPIELRLPKEAVTEGDFVFIYGKNVSLPYGEASAATHTRTSIAKLVGPNGKNIDKPLEYRTGNYGFSTKGFEPGVYKIRVKNNLLQYGVSSQELTLKVNAFNEGVTKYKVDKATLSSNESSSFRRQVLISFNEGIGDITIDRIVFGSGSKQHIESNYSLYESAIFTNAIPMATYNDMVNNLNDYAGYVVIKDNGREFKLYFSLEFAKM